MQTRDRPNYYLRKNFYKQYSYLGTPFLSENCDIRKSDNIIIYGHNINNSKMFGELENYHNEKFYQSHKSIEFYTLEEVKKYEIIFVFKISVNDDFMYYNFTNFNNEIEFESFIKNCEILSLYNTESSVKYGDRFMTLSTCDYSIKDGRLVIVAKESEIQEFH